MAKENLEHNNSEKKFYNYFPGSGLVQDEISEVFEQNVDEYEKEKFNNLKNKLQDLVELMDKIEKKFKKADDLWIHIFRDINIDEIYNEWFKGIEEQKISYYELHQKLFTLNKTLDEAIEAYNNKDL